MRQKERKGLFFKARNGWVDHPKDWKGQAFLAQATKMLETNRFNRFGAKTYRFQFPIVFKVILAKPRGFLLQPQEEIAAEERRRESFLRDAAQRTPLPRRWSPAASPDRRFHM